MSCLIRLLLHGRDFICNHIAFGHAATPFIYMAPIETAIEPGRLETPVKSGAF